MSGIENILKIKESVDPSLTLENIPDLFKIIANYLKGDDKVQLLIKENLLIMIELEEGKFLFF